MVVLDATAGNRMMWPNKNPPNIIFMDKEIDLRIPPDIICVWEYLPFRDEVFFNVIFDPPHMRLGRTSRYRDPKGVTSHGTWWGFVKNKPDLIRSTMKAQKEFSRVSTRLSFKWNETHYKLYEILKCFMDWVLVDKREYVSNKKHGKSKTWWLRFIKSS